MKISSSSDLMSRFPLRKKVTNCPVLYSLLYLAVFPVMLPVYSFSQLYLNLSIFLSYLVFIVVNLVELLILKSFVQEFFY